MYAAFEGVGPGAFSDVRARDRVGGGGFWIPCNLFSSPPYFPPTFLFPLSRPPHPPQVHRLTMFADYRVPVVLRQLGILRYSADLASAVDSKALLDPGSEVEQEIRGCCIAAVEALRVALEARGGGGAAQLQPGGAPAAAGTTRPLLCIELDWTLWEMGEAAREARGDAGGGAVCVRVALPAPPSLTRSLPPPLPFPTPPRRRADGAQTAPPHHRCLTIWY